MDLDLTLLVQRGLLFGLCDCARWMCRAIGEVWNPFGLFDTVLLVVAKERTDYKLELRETHVFIFCCVPLINCACRKYK